MVAGSMACGIVGNDFMARVGPDRHEKALARPNARLMDFTGKPLRGFVLESSGHPDCRSAQEVDRRDRVVCTLSSEEKAEDQEWRDRASAKGERAVSDRLDGWRARRSSDQSIGSGSGSGSAGSGSGVTHILT